MARRTKEELEDTPLSLVLIAGNIVDARAAEHCLTEMGVDYTVDLEPFTTTSMLSGVYMGACMYVATAEHGRCRAQLESQGLTDTVELESHEQPESIHGA